MAYSIVIAALVLTALAYVVLILLRKRLSKDGRYSHIVSLSITLVGTFIGVSMALVLYDIKRERDERIRLDCLYEAAIAEGEAYSSDVAWAILAHKVVSMEEKYRTSTLVKRKVTIKAPARISAPAPMVLETIGREAVLYRYMSPVFRMNVMRLVRMAKAYTHSLEIDPVSPAPEVWPSLQLMQATIDLQTKFLQEERKYLQGERSAEDMARLFDELTMAFIVKDRQITEEKAKSGTTLGLPMKEK